MEVPRDRLQLRDDPSVLSPPIVEPPYGCSKVVQIRGFLAEATLDVQVDGVVVVTGFPGGFPEPNGAVVPLPGPLFAGKPVQARQHFGGATSDWSPPEPVRDYLEDFPAGPPRPVISPAPVFKCGSRTGVDNLLNGAVVWITADGVEVGRVEGCIPHQGVNVAPDYEDPRDVVAHTEVCGDPGPPSAVERTEVFAGQLPAPTFETLPEGSRQLVLNGLVDGARFTVKRGAFDLGPYRTWGGRTYIELATPIEPFEAFQATQTLCPGSASPPGDGRGSPCSELPAPQVAPIQDGDTQVVLLSFTPDARIKVFVNSEKTGDGSGPRITLKKPIPHGAVVDVIQSVGRCEGRTAQELRSLCVAPPVVANPSWLNLFPVGTADYDGGPVMIRSNSTRIRGTVYYPADADGHGAAFNNRLAALGPTPIVFVVHGRHGSNNSHLGYDYFQSDLARMGFVAVSVDCNDTDQWAGGADNIHDRAELVIRSIAHFVGLNAGDPTFGGKIDFDRVGLMGHSRGGDAVVTLPEIITTPGVRVLAVLSLAPVDSGASSGSPHGYPGFLTILPAFDGDVVDNSGARFYDGARTDEFRCQLYVENANHNYFNRTWPDETGGGMTLMSRVDHERILSAYGCALFRHALLGHDMRAVLSRRVLPAGVQTDRVQVSFAISRGPTVVDDFDEGNGVALNSLGASNSQAGGLSSDEFVFSQFGSPQFNGSFYGATRGLVARPRQSGGVFRMALSSPTSLADREIWVRAAEIYNGATPIPPPTGFEMGVETADGTVAWVDSDEAGGLSPPQDRRAYDVSHPQPGVDKTKTMLKTLRFPIGCFGESARREAVALLIRLNRNDLRPIAFDDVQIV